MGRRAAIIAIIWAAGLFGAHAARADDACIMLAASEHAVIAAIEPGGHFRLGDGREGMFAGAVLAPSAEATVGALAKDRTFAFAPVGRPDRWGRQAFHVAALEQTLVRQGLAHAGARASGACLAPLLPAEAEARRARRGLWAESGHVIAASDGAALSGAMGRHILAEGTLVSARHFRSRVYLNFARYWKSGLSLIIAEKEWPMFSGNVAPETLVGKRLRARGHLEWRGGPAIVVGPDDRLEMAD